MSTDPHHPRVRIPTRVLSVRVATSTREAPEAAELRARQEAEADLREELRQEAFETARRETNERFESAFIDLARERQQLRDAQEEVLRRLEPHVVELALAAAEKLVAQEIEDGRISIQPIVETVLRELRDPGSPAVAELALSPDDYATLGSGGGVPAVDGVRMTADSSVPSGAVRVTTDAGRIWSDLESRVRSVRRALHEAVSVTS